MVHIAEEVQPCDYRTVHHAVICHGASLSDNDGLEAAAQAISRYTKVKKYILYSKNINMTSINFFKQISSLECIWG